MRLRTAVKAVQSRPAIQFPLTLHPELRLLSDESLEHDERSALSSPLAAPSPVLELLQGPAPLARTNTTRPLPKARRQLTKLYSPSCSLHGEVIALLLLRYQIYHLHITPLSPYILEILDKCDVEITPVARVHTQVYRRSLRL